VEAKNTEKTAVIGCGPAGMMAALQAAKRNKQVLILEKEKRPAKKLLLTGDGRCNLTSTLRPQEMIDEIFRGQQFLYSAIFQFPPQATRDFFEKLGVKLKEERGRRIYPASNRAAEIKNKLIEELNNQGVRIKLATEVEKILTSANTVTAIKLKGGKKIAVSSVILATGGISYPETGSDGSGYRLAEDLGHKIKKPELALVPLKVENDWTSLAAGLKLKNVMVKLFWQEDLVKESFGEVIISKNKLTGSAILIISCHLQEFKLENYKLAIDLKPGLGKEKLERRIQGDLDKYSNKYFKNALKDLLPAKLRPVIVKLSRIPADKVCHQITGRERSELVKLLKNLPVKVTGKGGVKEAIITSGGLALEEVEPATMASKKIAGLYFAGEILEPAAYTGGHNLQIAFSTGYLAGLNC